MYFWGYGISAGNHQMVFNQQKKPPMEGYPGRVCDMAVGNYITADKGRTGFALLQPFS